jgi:hypothetical protein
MPLREPDAEDPLELIGVHLPVANDTALKDMAECFAEELLRLGHNVERVLDVFRNPFYAGPHEAYRQLGEAWIRDTIDKYGRIFRPIEGS